MKMTVKVEGFKQLQRDLKKMSAELKRRIVRETYATALEVQGKTKHNLQGMSAWDVGFLANSVIVDTTLDGMLAEVGPTAEYGPYVEFGTKPHMPPVDALEGWAKRHGMDSAWPIAINIKKHGSEPRPYLMPAYITIVSGSGGYFDRLKKIVADYKSGGGK